MPKPATKETPTAPPIARMVGRQVRALRESSRLTQKQLADRAGILQQTLARLEKGQRGVTVDDLLQIAATLNVAPLELLSATFAPEEVPVTPTITLSPADARSWLRGMKPLPGGDADEYRRKTPAGAQEWDAHYIGFSATKAALEEWERAVIAGDIDQEWLAIQRLLVHAESGLGDLQLRDPDFFAPERSEWRRKVAAEQLGDPHYGSADRLAHGISWAPPAPGAS